MTEANTPWRKPRPNRSEKREQGKESSTEEEGSKKPFLSGTTSRAAHRQPDTGSAYAAVRSDEGSPGRLQRFGPNTNGGEALQHEEWRNETAAILVGLIPFGGAGKPTRSVGGGYPPRE